jgi:hypothetical protein
MNVATAIAPAPQSGPPPRESQGHGDEPEQAPPFQDVLGECDCRGDAASDDLEEQDGTDLHGDTVPDPEAVASHLAYAASTPIGEPAAAELVTAASRGAVSRALGAATATATIKGDEAPVVPSPTQAGAPTSKSAEEAPVKAASIELGDQAADEPQLRQPAAPTKAPAASPTPQQSTLGEDVARLLQTVNRSAQSSADSSVELGPESGGTQSAPLIDGLKSSTVQTTTTAVSKVPPVIALTVESIEETAEVSITRARLRGQEVDLEFELDGQPITLRVRGEGREVHISAVIASAAIRDALQGEVERLRAALEQRGVELGTLELSAESDADDRSDRAPGDAEVQDVPATTPISKSPTAALRRVRALA